MEDKMFNNQMFNEGKVFIVLGDWGKQIFIGDMFKKDNTYEQVIDSIYSHLDEEEFITIEYFAPDPFTGQITSNTVLPCFKTERHQPIKDHCSAGMFKQIMLEAIKPEECNFWTITVM